MTRTPLFHDLPFTKVFIFIVLFLAMLLGLKAYAENVVSIKIPKDHKMEVNVNNVPENVFKEACARAVIDQESSPFKKIEVFEVTGKIEAKDTVSCTVDARVTEHLPASPMREPDGAITRYSVLLDVATGKTNVAGIDERAAKKVATSALASLMIDLQPIEMSSKQIKYSSVIADKKCLIEVRRRDDVAPNQWLVDKLECSNQRVKKRSLSAENR